MKLTGAAAPACPFAAAPDTAAPSRAFIKFDTSCLPPNDISPSPTTKAGEYAPKLMLRGRALIDDARSETRRMNCMVTVGEETVTDTIKGLERVFKRSVKL